MSASGVIRKSYNLTDDGVEIIDSRQLTNGTIVPNFVVDLILPLIGYVGLGILCLLYRRAFTQTGEVRINLHQLAKAGGIGFRKLEQKLSELETLELIIVRRPLGLDIATHQRTVIELIDPPDLLAPAYVEKIKQKTTAPWLFKDERGSK